MKPWFKRSLFGFAGAALLAGSLAGCSSYRHGWGGGSEQDRAENDEYEREIKAALSRPRMSHGIPPSQGASLRLSGELA